MFVFAVASAGAGVVPACARHPPPAAVEPATLPALPRSSLAAVILHRAELNLNDDQVRELEQPGSTSANPKMPPCAPSWPPRARRHGSSGGGSNSSAAGAGAGAGAGAPVRRPEARQRRRHGRRDAWRRHARGRMGGGRGSARPAPRPEPGPARGKLEDRLDEDDTKAYLDGEAVLTEPQREQAREIASDYRAQLYDRRASLKRQGTAAGK